MRVVKSPEKLIQEARVGHAMFSFDLKSGFITFVEQITFTPNEIGKTIKHYRIEKEDGKIYMQAISPEAARIKFDEFLNYFNLKEDEKEKIKTGNS